ncbi:sensor histidine kinase [Paenibacillus harenae]|uniref:Two-component system sensor histidine kinase YesM n=1 Tax=Paenibacillus harenae TaxID=306543 RepID=A0ABT9TYM7_PAEHA|nr:histidine kinase [Paenibacillus harenae]MDQ0112472.1 two-component system sensor histidine kinase YesM [Paenibacillus harenae]
MLLLRKLAALIANAKFRIKLIVSYFLLVSVIILILGFTYYRISASNMLMNVRSSLGNVVLNNNQLLDEKLEAIRGKSDVLPVDSELYQIMIGLKMSDNESLLKADRRLTELLFQYFGGNDDIYASFIVTRDYTFGNGARMYVPSAGFFNSELHLLAERSQGDLAWIPTYDFARTFKDQHMEPISFEYSQLVSAVKELNLTYIDEEGIFHSLPPGMERPVLMINFTTDDFGKLFKDYASKNEYRNLSYGIVSAKGDMIIHSERELEASRKAPLWLEEAFKQGEGSFEKVIDGKEMLISFDRMESTGWMSYVEIPVEDALYGLKSLQSVSFLFLAVMLLVSALLAYLMSIFITKPIIRIKKAMKMVERGNFDIRIPEKGRDELGQLTRMFNHMNGRIQALIEENYASRLREKEAELMALNLQLNPHFLYNTLTTMYWIAVENGQQEISTIMRNLAEMLQTSTRNKNETWPLRTDLDWLEKYIYIMASRFGNQFKVSFEVDDSLQDMMVPKLFLQPFVENAIIHGFAEMEEGGLIVIKGWYEDDQVLFSVEDNGAGIEKDVMDRMKSGEVGSTGMPNVEKRIKLLYGNSQGIDVYSLAGKGTKVVIRMGTWTGGQRR